MIKRVAMISVHTCPLAPLGNKETGGMNVFIRELSRELGRIGIGVDIFTRKTKGHELAEIVKILPNVTIIHVSAGPLKKINKYEILDYIDIFAEHVLHYAQQNQITYDLIHSNYWLSGSVSIRLKQKWNIPIIQTYHTLGFLKNSAESISENKEKSERSVIEKNILLEVDRVITSNPEEKYFLSQSYNYSSEKIELIPWGVDLKLFKPVPYDRAHKCIGFPDSKIILYAGRIDPIKGIKFLIRAFHSVVKVEPLAHLLIIGGSSGKEEESCYTGKLKKLTEKLLLQSHVHFLGKRKQAELPAFYSASHVCVLPSLYESFGMAALEAMACGTAVIASNTGGLPTIVKDNETGFIVPAADVNILADRIKNIITDENLRIRLARGAYLRAQNFNWSSIAQRIVTTYEKTVNEITASAVMVP